MEWGYYPGCSLNQSAAGYNRQVRLILERLGRPVKEVPDWNCCGATSAGKLDDFLAAALPARNMGLAIAAGFSRMVIPCSGCYSRTLSAKARLEVNPALKEAVNAEISHPVTGDIEIVSILQVLSELVSEGLLEKGVTRKLTGLTAACYYGCVTRFSEKVPFFEDAENPQVMERVLAALGAETVDFAGKTKCCGASAAVNDKPTALSLMAPILRDAIARGAQCLVVSCPMCQLNMDAYQNEVRREFGIEKGLPVYYVTQLMGLAMGLDPKELDFSAHFVPGLGLVRDLGLLEPLAPVAAETPPSP